MTRSRSQEVCHRMNRLLKSFEAVARLRLRYELDPAEVEQITKTVEAALEQTRLKLQLPNQKMVFELSSK